MSEYERMKHVLGTLDYSNRRLDDESIDYTKLINESRNKVANILNKRNRLLFTALTAFKTPLEKTKEKKVTPDIILTDTSNKSLHDHFKSMVNLTNYLFYDILLSPKVCPKTQMTPIFSFESIEKNEIDYFAKEIDSIQEDLMDISDTVKQLQDNYRVYCENLLAFIDQKDALFDLFLDYYEEYFVSDQIKHETNNNGPPSKASVMRKPVIGRKKSDKTEPKRVTYENNEEMDEQESDVKKKRSNLVRRKSSVYMYGVKTENRFSILSKTETGTLIRHF
jgi:hypothetical protein